MDLMRLLRSLEEFLYEVMTWLVFYPRTFLRAVRHPIGTMAYALAEAEKPDDEQYADAISPPLFLLLTLFLSHLIELGAHLHPAAVLHGASARLMASDQNLIIVRSLMFAIFPLMFALEEVRRASAPLTRKSLRGPFFAECYPASVFTLILGMAGTSLQVWPQGATVAVVVGGVAVAWYVGLQVVWHRSSSPSWKSAVGAVFTVLAKAVAVVGLAMIGLATF